MNNAEVLKEINQVGENFGKMMSCLPTNYVNGYMQAVRDCKVPFYGQDHITDSNKMVVTNADRIRNMSNEELALAIMCPYDTAGDSKEIMPCIKEHGNNELVPPKYCYTCVMNWLKEKVEQ